MKDRDRLDDLDRKLRQAFAAPPDDSEPSPGVAAAVMSQVRREVANRLAWATRLFDLLVELLAAGMVLAWAVVRLGLALWPGWTEFLRVPAVDAVGGLAWWILQKAGGTLLAFVTSGFGSLFPLVLLGFLAFAPLALRFAGRSAS